MNYPLASIDTAALQHNLQQARRFAPNSRIMSVIKANGYGHGLLPIANALLETDAYAVARLDEAVLLRQGGINHAIVVLEGMHTREQFQCAIDQQITPVLHLAEHVELLLKCNGQVPFCWLMLETGMHRLGMPAEALRLAKQQLNSAGYTDQQLGLMSHFANSDLLDDSRNSAQISVMRQLVTETGLSACMANSAAIISLPDAHYQWVRPGLMLYGVSPFNEQSAKDLGLKPVMQLRSTLIATQLLKPGDQVGYGGEWTATKATRMGVVSCGYGDGYHRHLSNRGNVIIRDRLLPVIGRVSMDTICIDLEHCPAAMPGDEVLLWGSTQLPVEQVAMSAGTIAYELLSVLTQRVHRDYCDGQS
ncbi:alanine racemase [Methylophaga lonarensis MPL]|uniref:Alanine racemase n=1 Tax=Methylophaga lonarensis MPL TaxID=1286106 RepID=M7PHH1_9GAMM|nr:alanine racemase [Methylophaga lonarensis]EMR13325.1 alanine racemase [Methylophaga lonarensis MPL]